MLQKIQHISKKQQLHVQASITVFLTLILLLITALLCTTVEVARIQGAKGFSKVLVNASIDTIYSTYQRELYDNYRIFGYDIGGGDDVSRGDQLAQELEINLKDMLESMPKGISRQAYDGMNKLSNVIDWYNLQFDDVKVKDITTLTDYKGSVFLNEVLEFMKYSAPLEMVTELLEKWNLYASSEEATTVMNKKLETQEAVGSLGKDMLALMAKVEGVKTDKNGVSLTKSNTVKVHNTFAKKIIKTQPSMEAVKINNPIVFSSLQGSYFNIVDEINSIIQNCKDAIECNKKIEKLKKEKESLEEEKEELAKVVEQQAKAKQEAAEIWAKELDEKRKNIDSKDGEEGSEESYIEPDPSEEELRLDQVNERLDQIGKKIKTLKKRRDSDVDTSNNRNSLIIDVTSSTTKRIDEACEIIDKIENKSQSIAKQVESYEEVVEENKSKLNSEQYNEIQDNITDMKEYIGLQESKDELSASSAITMREPLQTNKSILQEVHAQSLIEVTIDTPTLEDIISGYTIQLEQLSKYSITELRFDYSSLKLEPEVDSPVSVLLDLLKKGLLELVVKDSSKVSCAKVSTDQFPSKLMSIQEEPDIDCTDVLDGCEDNKYNSKITNTFSMDNSIVNDLSKTILLNQYQVDFFNDYVSVLKNENNTSSNIDTKNSQENKLGGSNASSIDKTNDEKSENKADGLESALLYEREYMIVGKNSDQANLSSIATRLVVLRSIFNFIYLFTDKEKTTAAYTTAVSIVGFTCLGPLIELVKVLILYIWALEESIVDTYALFAGYKVPLIKTKTIFKVQYKDLITFNKARIIALGDGYKKDTTSYGSFTYTNYLRVFLLLSSTEKNCYRTMDMIQMNMQANVSKEFKLSNCLFGMRVSAQASIPEKMITLPFIRKYIGETSGRYSYQIEQSNAY